MPKALFLDRDGVINYDFGYVYKISDFKFINGIFDLCKAALKNGYQIIVITNQSGIERGYFCTAEFEQVNQYMLDEFLKNGTPVTDVFYCPFLHHQDRKPSPAMFIKARDKYNIDMSASVSIGDKLRDIQAGYAAGVGKNYLFSADKEQYTDLANKVFTNLIDIIPKL